MGVTMAMMKFPNQLAAVVSETAIPGKAERERERESNAMYSALYSGILPRRCKG